MHLPYSTQPCPGEASSTWLSCWARELHARVGAQSWVLGWGNPGLSDAGQVKLPRPTGRKKCCWSQSGYAGKEQLCGAAGSLSGGGGRKEPNQAALQSSKSKQASPWGGQRESVWGYFAGFCVIYLEVLGPGSVDPSGKNSSNWCL
jgi:hypothetical protein